MTRTVHSLLEINQLIKNTLKQELGEPFWIVAEILEIHLNRSGHCYLELIEKEETDDGIRAKAPGTIWASRYRMLRAYFETATGIPLDSGLKILFRATVEFHELYGYSLNITDIDPAYTLGDLARKKQEVISRLIKEGVFDMNREVPMPAVLQNIAVVSSNTAAGYGDFMDTLEKNSYGYAFRTILFPAMLQGTQAVPSIIRAFDEIFTREAAFDCVVLIRGGGSQSDLECFNHYDLASHIAQFPLPVLTGIGHERDESVADLVAARKLKTPTAVAEFLIDRMLSFEMALNGLSERLQNTAGRIARENLLNLKRLETMLVSQSTHRIRQGQEKLTYLSGTFARALGTLTGKEHERLNAFEKVVELIRPETILARGYSITRVDGRTVKSLKDVRKGGRLETILKDGRIWSNIEKLDKKGTGKN